MHPIAAETRRGSLMIKQQSALVPKLNSIPQAIGRGECEQCLALLSQQGFGFMQGISF